MKTIIKDYKLILKLKSKPLRTCYTVHECWLCEDDIVLYENYYDGGYGKRAHKKCAENLLKGLK